MHHTQHFLQHLALVLALASFNTWFFQRLGLPIILGYIVTGMMVGPHVPLPFLADSQMVHVLSELGIILLMFSLGLEFSVRKFVKVFPLAGLIAVLECSLMMWLGYLAGQAFGWTKLESVYAGAIVAISSTTIILKAFQEQGIKGRLNEIVFGVLIVEDLVAILLLTLLPKFSLGKSVSWPQLFETFSLLGLFMLVILLLGLVLVPRIVRSVAKLQRPEILLILSIALCFSLSWLAQWFQYSIALGAFLAGSLIAESGEEKQIEHLVHPIKDIFGAIFFVSVGMLINPGLIIFHWKAVVVFTCIVIIGKIIGVTLGAFLSGLGTRLSLQAGMSLAQIGEFSFILVAAGISSKSVGDFLFPVAVAVSAITTLTTPSLIKYSLGVATYIDKRLPSSLQTFIALYNSWTNKIRTQREHPSFHGKTKRLLKWMGVDFIILLVLVMGASFARLKIESWLVQNFFLPVFWIEIFAKAILLFFAMPFVWALIRSSQALVTHLSALAIPLGSEGKLDLAYTPRKALVVGLQLMLVLLISTLFLALSQPFLPIAISAPVMLGLVTILAFLFWKKAENLESHVKAGALVVAKILQPGEKANVKESEKEQFARFLPGIDNITPFTLPAGSTAENKNLRELNLRGITGANVIAIIREDKLLVSSGKEMLQANDVLALVGSEDSIFQAKKMLGSNQYFS